ncbi:MAG TPA: NHLP bacteriocin export ABC transporter permease/ATPase subunit, partial [Gemmatimonadaceae bacterium]|nr:NHLP bacteriocin export ABC transporter permease/ATPase subunit [Gemmatimonadaceae bacterium]
RDGLKVNGTGYTPISRRAWLQVAGKSRLLLVDTGSLLVDPDQLWDGLGRLHALVLHYADQMAAGAAAAARDRMRRKAAADRGALSDAFAHLAGAMRPDAQGAAAAAAAGAAAAESSAGGRRDVLLEACELVGRAMGVGVKSYPAAEGAPPPRDPLAAIARASRLRTRKVALREGWWRQDNGPLLGMVGDPEPANGAKGEPQQPQQPQRPVALIPRPRGGGYVLHDPTLGAATPVTPELASLVAPFAQTFYRPFPDAALTVRDVVTFGLRGCGADLGVVVGVGVVGALLGMVPSMATGVLFNTVIPGAQRSQLLQMTLVLLVAAIATAMFNITRAIAMLRIEGRMGAAIQAAVWDRLLSLPMPFFRPYTAGDLAVRAMGIDAIRQMISGTTITAILSGIFSLFNFALMFHYSAAMAWRASLLIAIAIAVTALGSWLQLSHQRGISALEAKTSGLVLQLLSGIAKLRVGGAEARAFAVWARNFSEQRRLQFNARRIGNVVAAFNTAFPVLATGAIFWGAVPLIQAGQTLRTGDFLAFLSAYGSCQGALLGTCMALLSTLTAVPLWEQAKPILETRPEVDLAKSDPGTLSGDIEIQHAVFRYQPDGAAVLRDLTLHVTPGEFVAFVGPSGSGKSTILRLLLGFETLESGAIHFDGQELGGLDIQAVRRQIGVVLQTGRLMSGDIFTNIVGSAPLSMDDAWEAARMAGFDEDVKAMPMGMHTVISDGGGTLSGGQRQRLLIARAIVHRPRILFFDEATSALDNRTQAVVSASLEKLQATRIVVAHRLSTIVNADRIVVIEKGRVVQSGTYKELIAREGLFAELAKRQLT